MNDFEYVMNLERSVDSLEYQLEQKEEEIKRLRVRNKQLFGACEHMLEEYENGVYDLKTPNRVRAILKEQE